MTSTCTATRIPGQHSKRGHSSHAELWDVPMLMLGIMIPTLDAMPTKTSCVHDAYDTAILAPITVLTPENPFL
ncbi:unnamed protein product [Phytophthora fragariaefolia]|uniref:Unnamed protein product n=1 Tax=Phytophthora fragariaefolia TaxID=1490495 RepID=A0A9W7CWK4_9STRA|nr:unnamed protein product [Phytophthora fragariaefolia]